MKKSGEKRVKRSRGAGGSGTSLKAFACCALLAAAVFALYLPLLGHAFHDNWDDGAYITNNDMVMKGVTFEGVRWAFSNISVGFYYPLTWLSHMLDAELYGMDPSGHYFTNIIIHSLNVVLIFLLLGGVTERAAPRLIFAGLFAIHPMNVESVAWLAERKNLLSAFFLLLALWAYHKKTTKGGIYNFFVYLFFILGLMSKSNIVMFPVLLLLIDRWPLGRAEFSRGSLSKEYLTGFLREKGLLFIPSIIFGTLTILAQKELKAVGSLASIPLPQRFGEVLLGYGFYILKLFLPFELCSLYPHHHGNYPFFLPLSILFALALMTGFFWYFRKKDPVLTAGWLFFLISLLPVIGIIQTGWQAYADRYVYFAYWGLFAILVFGIPWKKISEALPFLKILFPALIVPIFVMLFALSRAQLSTWKNDETLFSNIIRVSPGSELAYYRLGNYYELVQNDPQKAASCYEKALELKPGEHGVLNNLAGCYLALGDQEKAIKYAELAIKAGPEESPPHYNKACALIALHRDDEAMAEAMTAIKYLSGSGSEGKSYADLLIMIGRSFGSRSEFGKAEDAYRQAVKMDPQNSKAWCEYGYTLLVAGKTEEGTRSLIRSTELDTGYDLPVYQLALLDLKAGNGQNARARLRALKSMNSPLCPALEKQLDLPK